MRTILILLLLASTPLLAQSYEKLEGRRLGQFTQQRLVARHVAARQRGVHAALELFAPLGAQDALQLVGLGHDVGRQFLHFFDGPVFVLVPAQGFAQRAPGLRAVVQRLARQPGEQGPQRRRQVAQQHVFVLAQAIPRAGLGQHDLQRARAAPGGRAAQRAGGPIFKRFRALALV